MRADDDDPSRIAVASEHALRARGEAGRIVGCADQRDRGGPEYGGSKPCAQAGIVS
jgi:hypothetical protein